MTARDQNTDPAKRSQEDAEKAARQVRLEAQLRANLQRRKAQVRARKGAGDGGPSPATPRQPSDD